MKVTEQDIIRTARQLRDEANQQQHVSPWSHRPSGFAIALPGWLVAVPAAAILGFVFGFWTKGHSLSDEPLTALVDTVYIKVHDPQPRQDTIAQVIPAVQASAPKRSARPSRSKPAVGRPLADDHIHYDLLVKN
ncbi:MAG: hypothetical protein IKR50_07985 [Prevotella sp.]|nr:hypothetical protein [Prevotella sp.]